MKTVKELFKLPQQIKVDVKKGETGVLIADLPEFELFTEANDLNELFINVNDLICTYYDIPTEYHNQIRFIPNDAAIQDLMAISREPMTNNLSQFTVDTFYTGDLCRSISP